MPPVVLVALDSADPVLYGRWLAEGRLPVLAGLRERGAWGRLAREQVAVPETGWSQMLTGRTSEELGFWSHFAFDPATYRTSVPGLCDYAAHPPFYALGGGARVAMVDVPQTPLAPGVDGIQVRAWGAHAPFSPRDSAPSDLLAALDDRHGRHPAAGRDHGRIWQRHSLSRLFDRLLDGAARRGRLCAELLGREDWDLFFAAWGESHTAGHYFYHLSEADHAWHGQHPAIGHPSPMRRVAEAVDAGMGEMLAGVLDDASVIVFSLEGAIPNNVDIPSMVILPELLYRWAFPGQRGYAAGDAGTPVPDRWRQPWSLSWSRALWSHRDDPNALRSGLRRLLPSELARWSDRLLAAPPGPLHPRDAAISYQPATWFAPHWPRMRAFALPSFSDGFIRLNVRGREREGVVEPEDFARVCDEIEALLGEVVDARSGRPLLRDVTRCRPDAASRGSGAEADLVARWSEDPADVVDHPRLGRIGPVPPMRPGGHRAEGFVLGVGPGFEPGGKLPDAAPVDLAPTVLRAMGRSLPTPAGGRPLQRRGSGPLAT